MKHRQHTATAHSHTEREGKHSKLSQHHIIKAHKQTVDSAGTYMSYQLSQDSQRRRHAEQCGKCLHASELNCSSAAEGHMCASHHNTILSDIIFEWNKTRTLRLYGTIYSKSSCLSLCCCCWFAHVLLQAVRAVKLLV
jgi:hypothetical protein